MRRRLVIAVAVGALMSASLFAHHGSAAFDNGKVVILKGAVVEWIYSNPHCLLTLDVKGEDGTIAKTPSRSATRLRSTRSRSRTVDL